VLEKAPVRSQKPGHAPRADAIGADLMRPGGVLRRSETLLEMTMGQSQAVDATVRPKTSEGFIHPSLCLGRPIGWPNRVAPFPHPYPAVDR
jgi:hypothetical protein